MLTASIMHVQEIMEHAPVSKAIKVAIELHEGEETKKIWHFTEDSIRQYSKDVVEAEFLSIFLHVHAKKLWLRLYHFDEIAGKVNIESDGDMQKALTSFNEEWHGARRHNYLLLHAEDICPVNAAEARPKEHAHSTVTSKRKVSVTAVPWSSNASTMMMI